MGGNGERRSCAFFEQLRQYTMSEKYINMHKRDDRDRTYCLAIQLQNSNVSSPMPHPREKSANLRKCMLWWDNARACSLLYRYNLTTLTNREYYNLNCRRQATYFNADTIGQDFRFRPSLRSWGQYCCGAKHYDEHCICILIMPVTN